MADHFKATEHHAKAGNALAKGDFGKAAHHLGHAMNALRKAKVSAPKPPSVDAELKAGQSAYMGNIRKAIKK